MLRIIYTRDVESSSEYMNLELKAGQFHDPPVPGKEDGRTVFIHPLAGRNGFAFALTHVGTQHKQNTQTLLTVIRDHLEHLSEDAGHNAHVQHAFERFLARLNETISLTVKNSDWNLPIGQFGAVVGIAEGSQMYLSGNGDIAATFLHRTQAQRYQVFNLSRSIQTEQALPTWEKAFAVVLDGELHPGDALCLASHELQPAIDTDELCSILSTLPPTGAAAKIRQYFSVKTGMSILVMRIAQEERFFEQASPSSEYSLNTLGESREETARLLEDQSPRPSRTFFSILRGLFPSKQKVAGSPKPTLPSLTRKLARVSGFLVGTQQLFARLGKHTRTRTDAEDPETRAALVDGVRARADRSAHKTLHVLKSLPRNSKYLLGGAVVLLVVLMISIRVLSSSHATSEDTASYTAALDRIRDVREQAAAAVIYQDESRARSLYQQAMTLTQTLPTDTPERAEQVTTLTTQITQSLDELRRAITIADPPVTAALEPLGVTDARALVAQNGLLYILSAGRTTLRVDPAAGKAEPLIVSAGEVGTPTSATSDDGRILFLDERPGLSRLDLTGNALHVTDLYPGTGKQWNDLVLYSDKLYVLQTDSQDGQILRYPRSGSGWGAPTDWIRSKTISLANAKSIAIDATIFLLTGSDIVRFSSGGQMGWKPAIADPKLEQGTDLWTDTESSWLYVLEPSKQRILVYSKDSGSFINQYIVPAFSDAVDFTIDEDAKTAYVLTHNTLYTIRLSHLP